MHPLLCIWLEGCNRLAHLTVPIKKSFPKRLDFALYKSVCAEMRETFSPSLADPHCLCDVMRKRKTRVVADAGCD